MSPLNGPMADMESKKALDQQQEAVKSAQALANGKPIELGHGLSIRIQDNGVLWLFFESGTGSAGMDIDSLAAKQSPIVGHMLSNWCKKVRNENMEPATDA